MTLYNLKKKNNTTDNSNTIFKVSVDCFSLICFNLFVTTGKKNKSSCMVVILLESCKRNLPSPFIFSIPEITQTLPAHSRSIFMEDDNSHTSAARNQPNNSYPSNLLVGLLVKYRLFQCKMCINWSRYNNNNYCYQNL